MDLFNVFNKEKESNNSIKLDDKVIFLSSIKKYYLDFLDNSISIELLDDLSNFLADELYQEYNQFRNQYPKSIKRYSTLKISDLENPSTHDKIISFFKKRNLNDYAIICSSIFKLSLVEFKEYEKQRFKFNSTF